MAYLKTAEARIEYRGEIAFFGEPDALLPGHETRVPFLQQKIVAKVSLTRPRRML